MLSEQSFAEYERFLADHPTGTICLDVAHFRVLLASIREMQPQRQTWIDTIHRLERAELAALAESDDLRAQLADVQRKASEQSEYIQSHGLTEYEMERVRAQVKELEPLAGIGRAFLALPDRSEVWIDRGSPCNVEGLNPILSNRGLLSAVRRYVQKGETKE